MSELVAAPVFVVGTPRSGTTLTARVLGNHPLLFMPGETHFFDDLYARREQLGFPFEPQGAKRIAERLMTLYGRYNEPADQARIEALIDAVTLAGQIREHCRDYGQVLRLFMELQMQATLRAIWGNNAPRDIFNIREISAFYPDARIVVCVRDPRDFLGSYKGKWRATAQAEVDRLRRLYHPVVTSLLWKASMKQLSTIERVFSPDQVLVLPYEKLVVVPEDCAVALCRHVGVEYDPRMLEVEFSNSSDLEGAAGRIFSTSVGSWRKRISDNEAWIAERLCAPEMCRLGYPREAANVSYLRILGQLLTVPYALWRGLQANKDKRGPLLPYLFRRLSAVIGKG